MDDRNIIDAEKASVTTGARRRRVPTGTKPSETAGGALERRIARVEFGQGALVRLRVPVPADVDDPGREVLTDVDVLAITVDNRLKVSASSFECKSGKGQSGEATTIVWLAGFRQLLDLDHVSIVRQTMTARGRSLARRLGITAFDDTSVDRLERPQAWLPARFAHVDGPECANAEERAEKQLKGLPTIPSELVRFLRGYGLLANSPSLISAVTALGSAYDKQGAVPEPTNQILSGHALIALILAGIKDAGRIDQLGEAALRKDLERALVFGDTEDDFLLRILERADAIVRWGQERTHRAYVENGAQRLTVDVPSLRDAVMRPASYLDDYIDFVVRLRANPLVARELLQTAELVCFDALIGGNAWRQKSFEHLFTPEHRGLVLVALRCLGSVGGSAVVEPLKRISDLPFRTGAADFHDRFHSDGKESSVSEAPVQGRLPLDGT